MIIDLVRMQPGQKGMIVEIQANAKLSRKVEGMGLRPGKKITKISSHFWRGPQTIQLDNLQLTIGFGIAKRILVEIQDDQ